MAFDISQIEDPDTKAGVEAYLAAQLESQRQAVTEEVSKQFGQDVAALRGNNEKLVSEKKAEEEKRKNLEAIFGKRDPAEVGEMLKRFENDEDASLLQSGKLDEYRARIQERAKAESDARVETEATERAKAEAQAEAFKKQLHDVQISSAIKSEFVANGGRKDAKAQEYAAIEAARWWHINEDGKEECRDPVTGDLVKGKTGLITKAEWVQEKLRPEVGILFEDARGTGSSGGGMPAAGLRVSQMSSQQQGDFIAEHGDEAFLNLPN